VAITTFEVCSRSPATSTSPPDRIDAVPWTTSIPRSRTRPVNPFTSLSVIASSKATIADQSGSPAALMPHSEARSMVSITAADCSSAFVGMHPRSRHVPPRRSSRSTIAVRCPSSAARSAAEYPPVPAPTTMTSYASPIR
jgi:hypothetical protein